MARIDSVFANFVNHVTSGLSGFITAAHDACARAQMTKAEVELVPTLSLSGALSGNAELLASAQSLRSKLEEILAKESRMPLTDLSKVSVEIDFSPDETRVEDRRRRMADIPVYYGYNPVYRCTVSLCPSSGNERTKTVEDLD